VAAVIVTGGPQKEDENLGRKEKAAVLHEVSPWLLVTEHLFVSFPLLDLNSLNVVFLLFTMQNDASYHFWHAYLKACGQHDLCHCLETPVGKQVIDPVI